MIRDIFAMPLFIAAVKAASLLIGLSAAAVGAAYGVAWWIGS